MGSSPQDRGADGSAAAIPAPSPPRALDVDRDALEAAVRDMLRALGEDVHREGLADTPKRVAKAMAFAVRGYGMSATHHVESALFHEPGLKSDEEALAEALADDAPPASLAATPAPRAADPSALARPGTVLVRDIPFFSTNEDTLLPFYGRCHVGYVPREGVIVGLSKVARVAEVFARRAQTPDRLAADVADALARGASPRGVRVLLEAAQMGPHGPTPVRGEADVGCFQSTHPEGAQYRAEFAAMLAEEVGAGIGPGVGLGGGGAGARARAGGAGASAGVAARGASRPSPEGRYPSPNVADDVEVGSVTTTTRLPIGDGEGVGDRVGVGAGGGSADPAGSDGGSDASDDAAMAMDDAKVSPGVSEENADGHGPVEGAKGVNGRAAPSDDSGSRPATPALLGEFGGAAAPPAAAEAVERMIRALGLDARMSADRLAATARRYADLMAASREGHAMAASDAAAAGRGVPGTVAPAAGEKRKRRAADRPDDATKDAIDGSFEMVVERDLELATLCEHHLLPFHGAVHIAYLRPASGASGSGSGPGPGSGTEPESGSGLTRAALQRIVTTHGRRLQVQERLTRDIARDVRAASGARGVMVAVRASHLCMIARGVEKPGSTTCTSACLGAFAGSGDRRGAFWSALAGDARGGEEGQR